MYASTLNIIVRSLSITLVISLSVFFTLTQAICAENADQDNPVIGINVPLSGPYKQLGQDQLNAYKLAIERTNEQGGVLGKKIEYKVKDTQTDPRVAKKNALQLINEDQAVMLTGGSSSSVAMAQSDVCQKQGVIFMAAMTHSSATTGFMVKEGQYGEQKAHRHTFRWHFNAWMTQKALNPYLRQEIGGGKDYFYITVDYTWGHSLESAFQHATESAGSDTVGSVNTKLGQKNFAEAVQKAKEADPDILVLTLFGRGMIRAAKQVHEMGLDKDTQVIIPSMELNAAHEIGPETLKNVISTTQWFWGLEDKYSGSKKFVNLYRSRYNKPPGQSAASAWTAFHEWISAVERAESFSSGEVIKALEGHTFELLKDEEKWRSWDHQAISSVYVVQGKSRENMRNEWDLIKILDKAEGMDIVRSRKENPVMLEPLESE